MCGIVGYIGKDNAVDIVIEGLKRLEYRGYDSAGISFKNDNGHISLFKKSGKIQNLEKLLEGEKHRSNICIGHTRWATHGEVNDVNAHPHATDSMIVDVDRCIAIVHNGIIENADVLKTELKKTGIHFKSDTDSEVYLGLLLRELSLNRTYLEAIVNSFKQIEGNSAFVIQFKDSNEIYALKRSAPLVCGLNKENGEVIISSDPYALAGRVRDIYFPEDEVIIKAGMNGALTFLELNLQESNRIVHKKLNTDYKAIDKGTYDHFMLKEINEQPGLIRALTQYYFEGEGLPRLENIKLEKQPERIHIVACGTAWHAGLIIKNFLESYNQIHCHIDWASEFRYRNPLIKSNDMALFISQSGETADTLAAQKLCKEKGIKTFSIVNVEGSTLYRDCYENLLIQAGVEICVASTKAFTQQVLTGYLTTQYLLGKDVCKNTIRDKFSLLANRIESVLNSPEQIEKIAHKIYTKKGFIFTGRGIYFPVALEGALKLKEIAYVHAEGYAAGELKHGPIALIDENMVNIAIVGPELYDKTVSNIQEVKARRGIIVIIGPQNHPVLEAVGDYFIPLDFSGLGELSPVYVNVVTQLLAYYMAKFKGTDIDKPRNLAKSVTVE